MLSGEKYGFIGGGNMGEALIKGLLESQTAGPGQIMVYDPDPDRIGHLTAQYGIEAAADNPAAARWADLIVLAVKPQFMDQALSETAPAVTPDKLIISVAAGVTLAHIQEALPVPAPVIRAMPNTPALVLCGASALAPGDRVEPKHLEKAVMLFSAVGLVVTVDEKQMDVVTGLSGSGPAFVFVLLEALADGAVRMGLPRKQALQLAAQTVMGAAKLALESGRHPGELKDMVTSPGGTTAAGLYALEEGAFRGLLMEAVAAATARSKELGRCQAV